MGWKDNRVAETCRTYYKPRHDRLAKQVVESKLAKALSLFHYSPFQHYARG